MVCNSTCINKTSFYRITYDGTLYGYYCSSWCDEDQKKQVQYRGRGKEAVKCFEQLMDAAWKMKATIQTEHPHTPRSAIKNPKPKKEPEDIASMSIDAKSIPIPDQNGTQRPNTAPTIHIPISSKSTKTTPRRTYKTKNERIVHFVPKNTIHHL